MEIRKIVTRWCGSVWNLASPASEAAASSPKLGIRSKFSTVLRRPLFTEQLGLQNSFTLFGTLDPVAGKLDENRASIVSSICW
jgi:hypothetical protein